MQLKPEIKKLPLTGYMLRIEDFSYALPAERIAEFPLHYRDQSKLLVYRKGKITHHTFTSLGDLLPAQSTLFFNNTRVIPARLHFTKSSGALIEIFLLSPVAPSSRMEEVMASQHSCMWDCTIGNLKRWKDHSELTLSTPGLTFTARLHNRATATVVFTWTSGFSFAEAIEQLGATPLPPYIKREVQTTDKERYQTVYSQSAGAVAAPTAGLHFTERVLADLEQRGIQKQFLTLHVSAGTFQPVKTADALDHPMHQEQVVVQRENLEAVLKSSYTVAVGTTAMRTLESLYWFGVKLLHDPGSDFVITQQDPYSDWNRLPEMSEAIEKVIHYMEQHQRNTLTGHTSIYIYPGYRFRVCRGLITNFHLPGSTLILLVAAFVGNDWRKMYDEALAHNYRFLSYGDSSLLLPCSN
jgi:S-adenosylmethionine:tRNA ribosyltransferase-isomerase